MNLPENAHQARLLRLLRDGGRSRAELAGLTGLARSKVATEVARLVDLEIVVEDGPAESRGGRRSTMVRLNPALRFVGVDVGVTSVSVAVTDAELAIKAFSESENAVEVGPKATLQLVRELLGKLRAEGHYDDVAGIGIGVPGPVSFRDGVPVSPPLMPGWDGFPLRERLQTEYGCAVVVDNDVNIMVLGERAVGMAKSADNVLFVKIGTGIGCGIVVHGEVYRGTNGAAGDIGHIAVDAETVLCRCGNTGCLEACFGGAALARAAMAAARNGSSQWLADRLVEAGILTAEDVGAAALAGDPTSTALIREGGRTVGRTLASLTNFFNPSLIVIGGGVAGLGHQLLAEIRAVVYRRSVPLATGSLPIVLSELGPTAGVLGAVAMAFEHTLGSA